MNPHTDEEHSSLIVERLRSASARELPRLAAIGRRVDPCAEGAADINDVDLETLSPNESGSNRVHFLEKRPGQFDLLRQRTVRLDFLPVAGNANAQTTSPRRLTY